MQVNCLVGIQLGESLLDLAERHERRALDLGDLELVRFAHIDDGDAEIRVVERALHFLHVNLVRVFIRLLRLIRDAAELVVVDQLLDGRVVAAQRTLWIAAQLDFAELHLERIENQQSADERIALAQRKLDDLRGLDASDDSGQHTQYAALGAAGHHARRWRLGVEAAVARATEAWREHARLAVEPEDRAVHVRLAEQHAGVVG